MLDIGCGTGRFLAQLAEIAKAWGVDASPEMLEVARTRAGGAGLKLGSAEELPFKDGWFERATMWLVAHLVDRPRAFAEAHRVLSPDGRFAVATFDPSYFDEFWLNELFPSMEAVDRDRFPTAPSSRPSCAAPASTCACSGSRSAARSPASTRWSASAASTSPPST